MIARPVATLFGLAVVLLAVFAPVAAGSALAQTGGQVPGQSLGAT